MKGTRQGVGTKESLHLIVTPATTIATLQAYMMYVAERGGGMKWWVGPGR